MADELDFPKVREPSVIVRVATISAATGALVGGGEGLYLAWTTPVVLGVGGAGLLALATVVIDSMLGLCFGLGAGVLAALPGARVLLWKRLRSGTSIAVLLFGLFFLGPLARELWFVQDRRVPAMGMIALAIVVSVTWWFNANYWFRRESIGAGPVLGWRVYAPLAGLLLAGVAAAGGGQPDGPSSMPPPGLPNLVLVTVDTLRRDHVGAFGGAVATPRFDRLAAEGAIFDGAITPIPETAPSHAAMLTGLHPARHKVIANGIPLKDGYLTVTEQLAITGYRTGAFVSSFAAGSTTGLDQGFQVYDDDFTPAVRGIGRARVARLALPLLLRLGDPADWPWLLERGAPATIAHALTWVNAGDGPFFLWVHVFEPHSPYERPGCQGPTPLGDTPAATCAGVLDHRAILAQEPGYAYTPDEEAALRALYAEEVAYTDTQLGALLDGLSAAGALENAMVVVTSDHGESLGEHDIRFNHHGLYDDVLRVPLVAWASSPGWAPGTRVARQVTVADIANTLLEFAGIPLMANTESVPLLNHVRGVDVPARPVLLLGRTEASLKKGQLHGVRDHKGFKYIQGTDTEELYDLTADPGELRNIAAEQPGAIEGGRANVGTLKTALGGAAVAVPADERLELLGYME
jgi:arylsulfatase A-like enzyme